MRQIDLDEWTWRKSPDKARELAQEYSRREISTMHRKDSVDYGIMGTNKRRADDLEAG